MGLTKQRGYRVIHLINVSKFIEENNHKAFYALVEYDGITEPTYFYTVDLEEKGLLDMQSPCEVFKCFEGQKEIEDYFNWLINDKDNSFSKEDIEKIFRPLIVDDVLYEVENFQCAAYLPEEVDNITICTERDCLLFILEHSQTNQINCH